MSTPAGRVERPAVKKAELVIKTGKGLPRPRSVVPTSDGIIALEHVHWLHPLTTGNGTKRRKPRRRVYVSFWGVAELHGRTASASSEAYDPELT
jgi:hypothetical protein